MQYEPNACIVPIKFPDEPENLVNCPLGEDVVNEMPDEKFHNSSLFFFARCTLRRIALMREGSRGVCRTTPRLLFAHLIIRVLQEKGLSLIKMLHSLLSSHQLQLEKKLDNQKHRNGLYSHHLREGFVGSIAPE